MSSTEAASCAFCEEPIEQPKVGRPRKFCSPKCQQRHAAEKKRAARAQRSCRHCGEPIGQDKRGDAEFCSPDCKREAHKLDRRMPDEPVSYTCEVCSTSFERPPTPGTPPKYCSQGCKAVLIAENKAKARFAERSPEEQVCPQCDGPMPETARKNQVYCSLACQEEVNRGIKREKKRAEYAKRRRDCLTCGDPVDPFMKEGTLYCSRKCSANSPREKQNRLARRLKRFGKTPEYYEETLEAQGGGCAICGATEPGGKSEEFFTIDHHHGNNLVRGLLCTRCNLGLGQFRDDPDLLRSAADYAEHWTRAHEIELLS